MIHHRKIKQLKSVTLFCLLFLGGQLIAQQTQVKGVVLDIAGKPLYGVNITAENQGSGKKINTYSSDNGLFVFDKLTEGHSYRFIFTYIGFQTDTLANYKVIKGQQISLSIKLKEQSLNLKEVVVGYGVSKRAEITGAVSSIEPSEFNTGVVSSPGQLLQGKVAGLNVTISGNPNENPSVILRGPSSFRVGAQEPFYVIDGVPGASINIVAPEDIASIEVLKDASSTAIYGSRAANGVIIITTRKAAKGQPRLSYSGYAASEKISNSIDMANAEDLRVYLTANGKTLDAVNDDGNSTNWLNEVTQTSLSHQHNLGLSGSGENSSYTASVNYLDNEGIIKTSSMNRFIVRGGIEQRMFENRLKLNLNINNSNTTNNRIVGQVYNNMYTYLPTVGVKKPDGTYTEDPLRTVGTGGYYNPVALLYNNTLQGKTNTYLVNGTAKAYLYKGLSFTTMLSLQNEKIDENLYYSKSSMLAQALNGYAQRFSVKNTQKVLESYFNYETYFGDNNLKLLAGYSWQENKDGDGFQASAQDFVSDDLLWNNLGSGNANGSSVVNYGGTYISTLRLISFYGRLNYDFNKKYLLQATLRRDGSSALGKNSRWGVFPSVSAGWNIEQEDFMQNASLFSSLKLRASYGESGNSAGFNAYTSRLVYGAQSGSYFYYNGQWINAIGPIQNDNPDLKWERTATTDLGLDFGILKNKITGSVDLYHKETSDLIGSYSVSTTQYPFDRLTANVGTMVNKGVEVTLSATPIKGGKFSWNTSFNIAHNKNEITSISNDKFEADQFYTANFGARGQSGISGFQIIKEGYPLGSFYTLRYAGKDSEGVSMFYDKDGNASVENTSFENFSITGSAQPNLFYGWNNTLKYQNFDFNFFFRGVSGNKILNATRADMNAPIYANQTNVLSETLGESIKDIKGHFISDRYLEDGSYLRLDNATLGYTFTLKNTKTFRVYAAGNNLFVITKYKGVDPEINMGGQTPGIDNRNYYPKTRTMMFGINVNL